MTFVFYISGHGFGHASRSLEVVRALLSTNPDIHVVIRSSVPRWFLEAAELPAPVHGASGLGNSAGVDFEHLETDVGMVQIDSLRIDEEATARAAAAYYAGFSRRVSDEASELRRLGASFVVGDIPPLASAAAAEAGIASAALGNFTWDWIYAGDPRFEHRAPGVIDTVARAYAATTVALRLPFHGGFETMRSIRDLPLIARRARRARDEVRTLTGIPSIAPVVLASFGGHGLRLPYAEIAQHGNFTLVLTDHDTSTATTPPSLIRLTSSDLRRLGLRYADLVAASDVVVSKPGYGIVSECIANDTALLYTSRGRFVEYDTFVSEMPHVLRCREIPQEDLLRGRWDEHIRALLDQLPAPDHLAINGAELAAMEIATIRE